jgi:hypothetical protein
MFAVPVCQLCQKELLMSRQYYARAASSRMARSFWLRPAGELPYPAPSIRMAPDTVFDFLVALLSLILGNFPAELR